MNKKDFNFMCIWAKYLLSKDYNSISDDLQHLAEKGQIDAIQKWYEFNSFGDNWLVDKNINFDAPEYFLILANIERNKKKEVYFKCVKKVKELTFEADKITILQYMMKKDYMDKFENCCDRLESIRDKLKSTKYYKLLDRAKNLQINEYKRTANLWHLSLYIEILEQQYNLTFYQKTKSEIDKQNRILIKKIQQELPVVDSNDTIILYKYILGKTYIQSDNKKKREAGEELLALFANYNKNFINDIHHQFE